VFRVTPPAPRRRHRNGQTPSTARLRSA
jgi:hypothetical protein